MEMIKNNEKNMETKKRKSREQTIPSSKKKIEKKLGASDKGLMVDTKNRIIHFLDRYSDVLMAILTVFLVVTAFLQWETMENQNKINERQTAIMDDQKNISRELFNLQKSKIPRPVLFIEPKSDYFFAIGEGIITFPSPFPENLKTVSIHANETFTLTLVNAGSGPLNIKGVWGMYKCTNTKINKSFWNFPRFLNESKGRFTKVDNKVVAEVFESNVLMPDEKISSTIIIGFENDIAKYIRNSLNNYTCHLYFNIFYSYEGVEFNQSTEEIIFQWSDLPPEKLMEEYPGYQMLGQR